MLPLVATLAVVASAFLSMRLGAAPSTSLVVALGVGVLVGAVAAALAARPAERINRALRDGAESLRAGDYSLRLVVDRKDELGQVVDSYNRIVEALSHQRSDLRQRELLLDSMLERSEVATILVNAIDRVIYGNRASRRLFAGGRGLEGYPLDEILDVCPEPLRAAIATAGDALVTVTIDGTDESFHVTRRTFELNARRHVLIMVRIMTQALRRQEVAAWKRVIRVISHELGNSLAPIRSLVRSGRVVWGGGGDPERLGEILDTIDASAAHLHRFVDGYARLARLPEPHREEVALSSFLERIRSMEPFAIRGEVPRRTAELDPAQLQQVLVNLVKNACEAGSPREAIEVEVVELPGGNLRITVSDRGSGMDGETMTKAMLPFYSSKRDGSGLGLALSREIVEAHGGSLHLAAREGGGLVVRIDLPQGRG